MRTNEPARGLLVFEFRPFRGVKILANRSKAGEQNVPRTHTSEPARRPYTDKPFWIRFLKHRISTTKKNKGKIILVPSILGELSYGILLTTENSQNRCLRWIPHFLLFLFRPSLSLLLKYSPSHRLWVAFGAFTTRVEVGVGVGMGD